VAPPGVLSCDDARLTVRIRNAVEWLLNIFKDNFTRPTHTCAYKSRIRMRPKTLSPKCSLFLFCTSSPGLTYVQVSLYKRVPKHRCTKTNTKYILLKTTQKTLDPTIQLVNNHSTTSTSLSFDDLLIFDVIY